MHVFADMISTEFSWTGGDFGTYRILAKSSQTPMLEFPVRLHPYLTYVANEGSGEYNVRTFAKTCFSLRCSRM